VLTPERIILGGGWANAGDLIIEPIKAEMRRRVITTPVERIDVVLAELGTWAGAIGAAVHGAEWAAGAGAGVALPAGTRTSGIADAEGLTAAATDTA
jgi:predicted NBD/HSP70 family sugar kinase